MIKINLNTVNKQMDLSNLGGFDLSKLKIAAVIGAIVFMYVPDFVITPIWEGQFTERTAEFDALQMSLNSLKRKVAQSADLEKQIRELKVQEENLGQKLTAVKQAISLKRNPSGILLYIAKNMPADLWISELVVEPELMTIKGEALSYTSVGNFVNNLRSSVFIKDASIKNTTSTVRVSDKRRIESFEIHFGIARFE